jgi:hypothetical protein
LKADAFRTQRLLLSRETVRELDEKEMKDAAGGNPITGLCRYSLYVQCLPSLLALCSG